MNVETTQETATVLVADDEEETLIWTSHVLRSAGLRVLSARNAAECTAMLRREVPDLILMDVMMPAMGGIRAAAMIREIPGLEQVPIMFFSALPEDRIRPQMALVQGVDFIQKPCFPDTLIQAVGRQLYAAAHPRLL